MVVMSVVGCRHPEEGVCEEVSRKGDCLQGARLGVGGLPGAALGLSHVLERLALLGLVLLALAVLPVAPARSVPSALTSGRQHAAQPRQHCQHTALALDVCRASITECIGVPDDSDNPHHVQGCQHGQCLKPPMAKDNL